MLRFDLKPLTCTPKLYSSCDFWNDLFNYSWSCGQNWDISVDILNFAKS